MLTLTKRKQNSGFTLAELLIVVAIIGVLVAVSIPIFNSQTTKAKAATDMANVRSAKAAAIAEHISDGSSKEKTYYYDAASGTVTDDTNTAKTYKGYGKSTTDIEGDNATGIPNKNGVPQIVSITIATNGSSTAEWGFSTNSEVAKQVYSTVYGSMKSLLTRGTSIYSNKMDASQQEQYNSVYNKLSSKDKAFLDSHIWYMTWDSQNRLRVFFADTSSYDSGTCTVYKYDLSDPDKTKEGKYQVSKAKIIQTTGSVLYAGKSEVLWGYYDSNGNWKNNGWTDSYE